MPLPPNTPPPVGLRGLALRAAIQGQDAREAGVTLSACPYGPDRPFSRRAWVAGYVDRARVLGDQLPEARVDDVDEDAPTPG